MGEPMTMEDQRDQPEIIFNFWFVGDGNGYIHGLLGRAYIGYGSDENKTEFLLKAAMTDYRTAEEFPIPEKFRTIRICMGGSSDKSAVRADTLGYVGGIPALFEDIYQHLMQQPPAITSGLTKSDAPLKAITPLIPDANGVLHPQSDDTPQKLI